MGTRVKTGVKMGDKEKKNHVDFSDSCQVFCVRVRVELLVLCIHRIACWKVSQYIRGDISCAESGTARNDVAAYISKDVASRGEGESDRERASESERTAAVRL